MCNCRYVSSQPVAATTPANDAEDEMTQCLRWVTDAYNEFLVHGKLSEERVNRLQMVYDKLASENMAHNSSVQTLSNLSTMMCNSKTTGMQVPSLLTMNIPPPVSASAIPTIMGVGKPISSPTATSHENQQSRSRSVEKPLHPTSDVADESLLVENKSHAQSLESPVNSGLADGETMEMGSEDGGAPYSPFDSPYDLFDAKTSSAPCHGAPSDSGLDSVHMPASVTKSHTPSSIPPNSSPFSSAASDRGRIKPQPVQPPPVLTPQDILAARILDELALIEVLVRIQFELASIGDLSAEDAAEAGIAVVGGPSTPPASLQSPLTTTTATAQPKSPLKDNLPALPSPGSLQEMIGQSATPPSTTQQSTAVSATLSQSAVRQSGSGKVLPSGAIVSGKLPCTPPIEPVAVHSPATATYVPVTNSRTSTSTVTKPQSSSLLQRVKSSKPTAASASCQQRKTSSASANSETVKSKSANGSEKVFHILVTSYLMHIAVGGS